jgi:tRNA (cmo5U34)-methyltransferase
MPSHPADAGRPFSDPDAVARYREGPPRQVPGFADLHRMVDLLLAERTPDDGHVLVLGAGGGLELEHLAAAHPSWAFDGVDPSGEMLRLAAAATKPFANRIRLHEGYADSAPAGPFDAAACLLTLHFIPAAERLATLQQMYRRLKPGAPLVVAHHSFPPQPPERDVWLARYAAYGVGSGFAAAQMAKTTAAIGERLPVLSPEADEALLREAGFADVRLFYAALTFRGWVAHVPHEDDRPDPDAGFRARLEEHWKASERGDVDVEHAIYADDAILDYPQSGERFTGRAKIQAQRGGHPAERHFAIDRIQGGGGLWISECTITYDNVPTRSVSIMEVAGGLVTHETQYFADPFDPAPARAALAEPIPGRDR